VSLGSVRRPLRAARAPYDIVECVEQRSSSTAGGDAAESIARNTGFAFAVRVVSAAFTALLTLYLVRALDPAGYGLFGLAASVAALLSLPADCGVSPSAARLVAERRQDRGAAAGVVAAALRLKLWIAGTVSVVLFATAGLFADAFGEPALTWVLRGFSVSMLAESTMLLLTSVFVAQARTSLTLTVALVESTMETSASIALVLLGAGAAGAAFGRAIGYAAGVTCAVVLAVRLLGREVVARQTEGKRWGAQILRYGGSLLIVDSAYTLFNAIDVLIIGAFLTATAVGLFSAPMRLLGLLQLPAIAIATGVSPRMAAGFAATRDIGAFVRSLQYTAVFQVAMIPPLLVWAEPIVRVTLGPSYGGSASVLRALTPFAFLIGFGNMLSLTANYIGQARRRVPIAIVTVIVNAVVDVILIPRIGVVGGAIGTDLAYCVYVPAHLWVCRRSLDVPLRPIAGSLLRASVAAVAMTLVLATFGTHPRTLVDLVVGASLAVVAYVACLAALGRLCGRDRGTILGV